ncbi:MAG: branched-chain amino acid ABC transporter permease [Leucobacter sp.]
MITTLSAGLSIGAIYAIVAIGYNIVFVASKVFNFAQAQFLMIGTFIALDAGARYGLPIPLAILLCAIVGAVIGALEEILAIRRLAGKGEHNELVTTVGVSTLMAGAALVIWGPEPIRTPYLTGLGQIQVFGSAVGVIDLAITAIAILLASGVAVVTRRSMIGLASLASSEDRDAAMLRGIDVKRMALGAFVVAGALVAATAPFVGAKTYATYHLGDGLAVKAFVALAIGGFGSYLGALIGGFIVGLLEMLGARFLGSEWQDISVFVLLLIVLLVLPKGLFGRTKERVV